MHVELVCDNCGKVFVCKHKKRLEAKNHFCSRKCQGEYKSKTCTSYIPCIVCGKLHHVKPSHQERIKYGSCCSRECLGIYRSSLYKGENNPNYGNRGSNNPLWKSDKKENSYGYILVRMPEHPFANCDGFVFEHRLIAEQNLLTPETSVEIDGKQYLRRDMVVHHIDENRKNNSVENLKIMTLQEHTTMHASKKNKLAS